jgi:redox-sensing transcriptional repressor
MESDGRKIPEAVIKRISLYTRVLRKMSLEGLDKVSSEKLGEALGLNPAQIRKDLDYFGQFGVPGVGYYIEDLRARMKTALKPNRIARLALVGVGNLGQAILSYSKEFARQDFELVAAFDIDRRKIRQDRMSVPVYHVREMEQRIRELAVDIVILSVSPGAAHTVLDAVVNAGVKAVLNFVPERLLAPEGVRVNNVDISIEIEYLSYYLQWNRDSTQ